MLQHLPDKAKLSRWQFIARNVDAFKLYTIVTELGMVGSDQGIHNIDPDLIDLWAKDAAAYVDIAAAKINDDRISRAAIKRLTQST
jgi:hypothetical protein